MTSVWNLFRAAALSIIAAASCVAIPCLGQEAVPLAPTPLQVTTELVKLDVSVMDEHGQFAAGLRPANLRVLDNGVPQTILIFAPVDTPADILVLVETGPAVYLLENEHLVAAYALLNGLAPDDQVALATYDQSPRAVLPLTPDKGALLAALNQLQYTIGAGDLNLYDSVSTALDWLAPATNKKALVVLTTGIDSSPPARWDALVEKARNRDVVIFPVALGGSLQAEPKKKSRKGAAAPSVFAKGYSALNSLATITGGRAYFPESSKDFAVIYGEIATMLRHEYAVGIAPAHDGQFHSLGVEVLEDAGPPGIPQARKSAYRVFARQGYQAPQPAPR